jgi:hypothetical protein
MAKRVIPDLPPFVASRGPAAARQLAAVREKYKKQADALRAELAQSEELFAIGFEAADRANSTQDRIAALAQRTRR